MIWQEFPLTLAEVIVGRRRVRPSGLLPQDLSLRSSLEVACFSKSGIDFEGLMNGEGERREASGGNYDH